MTGNYFNPKPDNILKKKKIKIQISDLNVLHCQHSQLNRKWKFKKYITEHCLVLPIKVSTVLLSSFVLLLTLYYFDFLCWILVVLKNKTRSRICFCCCNLWPYLLYYYSTNFLTLFEYFIPKPQSVEYNSLKCYFFEHVSFISITSTSKSMHIK